LWLIFNNFTSWSWTEF